jgi:hypothetical protein
MTPDYSGASWFETRGAAALLTMRVCQKKVRREAGLFLD